MSNANRLDMKIPKMPPAQASRHRAALQYLPAIEEVLVEHIAARAVRHKPLLVNGHIIADLRMVHQAIVPLDLRAMLVASEDDFLHDINGLHQWLDRLNLQFTGKFWPRFAKPVTMEVRGVA